jgi:ribonuclease P protein component
VNDLAGMRRANRLRTSEEFSVVYRSGKRARTGSVVAIGLGTDAGEPKVGITCSKRVGGAVSRNRAKRRLRAAAEGYIGRMKPGSRVVLQATAATTSRTFQQLVGDVEAGLSGVGALDG